MKSPSARRPVFLDSTGRRHRTIRRAGAVLAIPVVGYLVLMTSSLFGGPRLDTPLVPLPEAVVKPQHRPHVSPPPEAIQTLRPTQRPTQEQESEPARTTSTPTPTGTPTPHTTGSPTVPPGKPTTVPTATPTTGPTTTPTTTPSSAHTSNKPAIPPGKTKTPGKP